MFCMFPDSKSEWKKGATGQSFIQKGIASYRIGTLVPLQKLFCRLKNQFFWMQIIFLSGTKCLWLAQYVTKFLGWLKTFGPAQNILGPVKGQGISVIGSQSSAQYKKK